MKFPNFIKNLNNRDQGIEYAITELLIQTRLILLG